MMTHEDTSGMSMDVSEERLFTPVLHLDGFAGLQCEKTTMHLQADVLTTSESAANTAECETNLVLG